MDLQKLDVSKIEGYTQYNFALFTGSLYNFFDLLRYDRAFLARKRDVDKIIQHIHTEHWRSLPEPVLLGMYDWNPPRKAKWTHARLCSGQRLEEIMDVSRLYELESDLTLFWPKPKLKFRVDLRSYTGTIDDVVRMMHANRGMPCTESDSHKIEAAYMHPDQPITVDLSTFLAVQGEWRLP